MPERPREHFTRDPFAITPDPEIYVPRSETERARKQLLRSVCDPAKATALIGPPGLGKTLLLHLLQREASEDMQSVYLPYAALPPVEFCAWVLELLGLPSGDDPIAALQALGGDLRERGSSLLISIDDAGAMPIATARWVGELVRDSGGTVRLAVAASDNAAGNRAMAAIGSNFDIVHLANPLTKSETRKYIDGRLAFARVPDSIRSRFDDRVVGLLHRNSAGIPRRLNAAAAEILQGASSVNSEEPGAPTEERRKSRRRAEPPDGVAVRIETERGGTEKGRRAEDRGEDASQPGESVAADPAEPEVEDPFAFERIEREAYDDDPISPWVTSTAATLTPREKSPTLRMIAMGSLLVAFVAVAIPAIRSLLSEPRQSPTAEQNANPQESLQEDLEVPAEAPEPGAAAALEALEEIRAVARAAEAGVDEQFTAEALGMLAVQINATPWANVEVDGVDLGATPLANIPLLAGAHSFRARMPDGRIIERTIEIDEETRFISFE